MTTDLEIYKCPKCTKMFVDLNPLDTSYVTCNNCLTMLKAMDTYILTEKGLK